MAREVAAGMFLINKKGELLICHPTNHSWGFWSIPKGKVEEGEYYIDAAIRETYEECNIDLKLAKNIIKLEPKLYKHRRKILNPFVVFERNNLHLNWDNIELKCNSYVSKERGDFPEMDAFKWVSLDVVEPLLHDTQKDCLEEIKKN